MKTHSTTRTTLTAGLLALASSCALAQNTRPGLWEIQHKMLGTPQMDAAMAEMQQQMAAMPPAQRKQMEAMMAAQGVSAPMAAAGGGMAMKVCITPEMAASHELPSQTEGDCTTTVTSRSGNTVKMRFVCTDPQAEGDGTYTFKGDTSYTMQMAMQSTRKGKTDAIKMSGQGKWLSASCGNIKPLK